MTSRQKGVNTPFCLLVSCLCGTGNMDNFIDKIITDFTKTFITDNRWKLFLNGFKNTMIITLVAAVLGIIIGTVISVIHYSAEAKKKTPERKTFGGFVLKFFDAIFSAYVAVMRGSPLAIQLMIMAFVIMRGYDKILTAAIAFGLNSGAYVSEVIRGGIGAVDVGQMEAGRSLGLPQLTTMRLIILPQAIKGILPALCNEGIAIIKETSIVGLIAVTDLTRASDLVRSRTLSPFFPLVSVGLIYFLLVMGLSSAVKKLERKLAQSDRG